MSGQSEVTQWAFHHGYRVNEQGQLVSNTGYIRRCQPDQHGYLSATVNMPGRRYRRVYLHKLQAYHKFGEAALSPSVQVRHIDGNPLNNLSSNIEIGTQSENQMDMPKDRRVKRAIHAAQRLRRWPDALVREMFAERALGMSYRQLTAKHGIAKSTLSYIFNKASYAPI